MVVAIQIIIIIIKLPMLFNQLSALWSVLWRHCKNKAYVYASTLQQQNLARADWQCCGGKWLPESCSKRSLLLCFELQLRSTAFDQENAEYNLFCCCCSFLIKENVGFCMHKYMNKEELQRGMQNSHIKED